MSSKATTPPLTGAELDKLEALARDADGDDAWRYYTKYQEALIPSAVLALIAQARAQQESAAAPAVIMWPSEKFVHERIATLMAGIGMTNDTPLWNAFSTFEADLRSRVEAVAPSDATGKADVAIAGGRGQTEAHKLAPILWGMCEGGGADRDADIYTDGYQAEDGDVYVRRAGELLIEQAAEISELVRYIDLLADKLSSQSPATSAADAKDAERYRQMKENDFTAEYCTYISDCLNERETVDLDAIIDGAAIAAAQQASPGSKTQSAPVNTPMPAGSQSANAAADNAAVLEARIVGLRTALRKISETRFGYDGDCGVTRIADDALYADEQAEENTAPAEKSGDLTAAVDAAMVEMANIHPPLRRSECERLIRAALAVKPAVEKAGDQAAFEAWARDQKPPYDLHVRPVEQQRGPFNIYSNQRTQHAYEGFLGAHRAPAADSDAQKGGAA